MKEYRIFAGFIPDSHRLIPPGRRDDGSEWMPVAFFSYAIYPIHNESAPSVARMGRIGSGNRLGWFVSKIIKNIEQQYHEALPLPEYLHVSKSGSYQCFML